MSIQTTNPQIRLRYIDPDSGSASYADFVVQRQGDGGVLNYTNPMSPGLVPQFASASVQEADGDFKHQIQYDDWQGGIVAEEQYEGSSQFMQGYGIDARWPRRLRAARALAPHASSTYRDRTYLSMVNFMGALYAGRWDSSNVQSYVDAIAGGATEAVQATAIPGRINAFATRPWQDKETPLFPDEVWTYSGNRTQVWASVTAPMDGALTTYTDIGGLDNEGGALYVGHGARRFNELQITLEAAHPNKAQATVGVQYWDGTGWRYVDNLQDGTLAVESGAVSFARSGTLRWDLPKNWVNAKISTQSSSKAAYWVRLVPQRAPFTGGRTIHASTAAMSADRSSGHVAVLHPNGLIYIIGGQSVGGTATATVDAYDPVTNTITAKTSMGTARKFHTATVLNDGRILVTGGATDAAFAVVTTETYNPVANTWTNATSMATARVYHTATILPNGNVLVAGGENNAGTDLDTGEVWTNNAGTGSWATVTGTMSSAHIKHAACSLPNGNVLITGGTSGATILSAAELYEFASDTWGGAAEIADMLIARTNHELVLLPNGKAMAIGGQSAGGSTASCEFYDPNVDGTTGVGAGSWAYAPSMSFGRQIAGSCLLKDGTVLVAGGVSTTIYTTSDSVERFDPSTNVWTLFEAPFSSLRWGIAVAPLPEPNISAGVAFGGSGGSYREVYHLDQISLGPGVFLQELRVVTTESNNPFVNQLIPAVSFTKFNSYSTDANGLIFLNPGWSDLDGAAFNDVQTVSVADFLGNAPNAGDQVYIGYPDKFHGLFWLMNAVNTNYVRAVVKYWNGSTWGAVSSFSDGTLAVKSGTTNARVSWGQTGEMSWAVPSDWATTTPSAISGGTIPSLTSRYYVQITYTTALDDNGTAQGGTPTTISVYEVSPSRGRYLPFFQSGSTWRYTTLADESPDQSVATVTNVCAGPIDGTTARWQAVYAVHLENHTAKLAVVDEFKANGLTPAQWLPLQGETNVTAMIWHYDRMYIATGDWDTSRHGTHRSAYSFASTDPNPEPAPKRGALYVLNANPGFGMKLQKISEIPENYIQTFMVHNGSLYAGYAREGRIDRFDGATFVPSLWLNKPNYAYPPSGKTSSISAFGEYDGQIWAPFDQTNFDTSIGMCLMGSQGAQLGWVPGPYALSGASLPAPTSGVGITAMGSFAGVMYVSTDVSGATYKTWQLDPSSSTYVPKVVAVQSWFNANRHNVVKGFYDLFANFRKLLASQSVTLKFARAKNSTASVPAYSELTTAGSAQTTLAAEYARAEFYTPPNAGNSYLATGTRLRDFNLAPAIELSTNGAYMEVWAILLSYTMNGQRPRTWRMVFDLSLKQIDRPGTGYYPDTVGATDILGDVAAWKAIVTKLASRGDPITLVDLDSQEYTVFIRDFDFHSPEDKERSGVSGHDKPIEYLCLMDFQESLPAGALLQT